MHHTNCGYCMVSAIGKAETHSFGNDGRCFCGLVALNNIADNTEILSTWNGKTVPVALSGRTLYKNGMWNTLCLPFGVPSLTGTPLEGATIMEMNTTKKNGLDTGTGTQYLSFKNVI